MNLLDKLGSTVLICVVATGRLFLLVLLFPMIEHPLGLIAAAFSLVALFCSIVLASRLFSSTPEAGNHQRSMTR